MQRRTRSGKVAGVLLLIVGPLFAIGASAYPSLISGDDGSLVEIGRRLGLDTLAAAEVRALLIGLATAILLTGSAEVVAGIGVLLGRGWGRALGILASLAALWLTGYFAYLRLSGRTEGGAELLVFFVPNVFVLYALVRGLWRPARPPRTEPV